VFPSFGGDATRQQAKRQRSRDGGARAAPGCCSLTAAGSACGSHPGTLTAGGGERRERNCTRALAIHRVSGLFQGASSMQINLGNCISQVVFPLEFCGCWRLPFLGTREFLSPSLLPSTPVYFSALSRAAVPHQLLTAIGTSLFPHSIYSLQNLV